MSPGWIIFLIILGVIVLGISIAVIVKMSGGKNFGDSLADVLEAIVDALPDGDSGGCSGCNGGGCGD